MSVVSYKYYNVCKIAAHDKCERVNKFNQEQKIYADEYTSGKYDFETYKRHISNLRKKYKL